VLLPWLLLLLVLAPVVQDARRWPLVVAVVVEEGWDRLV
jgi:hypothetical protein